RDIVVLLRDTGLRVKRELFRIRIEHLDWKYRVIMIPDSKTPDGKRMVPMSDRVFDLLFVRCGDRKEGWLFPANSKSGHIRTIDKQFHAARKAAGLSPDVKLQCCRHDWSTEMVRKTGNLPLVMKILGQTSLTAAMKYQIPEIENLRAALNDTRPAQSETIIN
ncbi:MAG TPA: tyrosine-type recombinase/integrase, partial [Candidatus Angelobacter sp.]|nr:tyrosine-type recombinase/integrase [Candidatus Angelobacter sp.]